MKKSKIKSLEQTRLENLTANLRDAWKSVASAILDFSLLLYEAFEGKIYLQKFKSWHDYVESELPIKRRQADYYRMVGEFYCHYEDSIKSDSLEIFTQKDFLKLISIVNSLPDDKAKKNTVQNIFKTENPQIEINKLAMIRKKK